MRIINLSGIFTGSGFVASKGRKPDFEDCAFLAGPIDLVIDDDSGKIVTVEAGRRPLNPREASIDGAGLYASPGMIDSHTHAIFEGERSQEFFLRWKGSTYQEIAAAGGGIHNTVQAISATPDLEVKAHLRDRLLKMAAQGTTSVEIKSGYADHPLGELRLLRLINEVRLENTNTAFPRVYSTFLGLHHLPKDKNETAFVDDMIAVLPKIAQDQLASFIDAFPEKGFFTVQESLRFCRAAQSYGLKPKIHADELSDLGSAKAFSDLGALSVDHLQQISGEGIRALAESSTVATLMPATSFFLSLGYADARRLIEGGARVALATDFNPGTAPESSMFFSIRLAASQLKMTAEEIFCATTYNAAAAIGESERLGALEPGRHADVLLWRAQAPDPRRALRGFLLGDFPIRHVLIGGKILNE